MVASAGFGKRQSAGFAFEQPEAKISLHGTNRLSHSALREIELFGGQPKIQMPRRGVEHLDVLKFWRAHWLQDSSFSTV